MERVWQCNYMNQAEAKLDVANYIAGFYNCTRLHSVLCNLPPSVYEGAVAEQELIVVSEITSSLQLQGRIGIGKIKVMRVVARITIG
ncbi:hypothetical protein RCH14_003102 [Massilia sp. MP_M2]